MTDHEPDRLERGVLLTLFVGAALSTGLIAACLGWGADFFS